MVFVDGGTLTNMCLVERRKLTNSTYSGSDHQSLQDNCPKFNE